MKIALIQDWLTELGGAEKVFAELYKIYPEADIFTIVYNEEVLNKLGIPKEKVKTSFIQKLPFAQKFYRNFLPIFSKVVEDFDLTPYDLIISSSYCVAKGVLTNANQTHICYCHSPVRYAWDLYQQYLNESNLNNEGPKGRLVKNVLHDLRIWDVASSNRVDHFISNSNYIAKRIFKVYRREATTIYPPVAVSDFNPTRPKEDFYFTCSRMVPYKKIDIIVDAFRNMPDKKLIVIGTGPDMNKIQKLKGSNVEILGYQPFSVLKDYMERAKAFVFAAEEDFGITPVEAQACGTPVIAYGKGGALETVVDKHTGIFFYDQTALAIAHAVHEFEQIEALFEREKIVVHARKFSTENFTGKILDFISSKMA